MTIFENIKLLILQSSTKAEQTVARIMLNKAMTISTVESCTGGLISSRLTDIAGSSAYIKENYVTYANEAKIKLLEVNPQTLEKFGAVSEQCALEMASGLFERANCDISLSITGIAGPGGATDEKKVGLAYVAVKNKYTIDVKKIELNPHIKRRTMKYLFSQKALEFLIEFLNKNYKQN